MAGGFLLARRAPPGSARPSSDDREPADGLPNRNRAAAPLSPKSLDPRRTWMRKPRRKPQQPARGGGGYPIRELANYFPSLLAIHTESLP